jgi:Phage protein (N4 Gp49/phage Sf6 gene 66) family
MSDEPILSTAEANALIPRSAAAPRVTEQDIKDRIARVHYLHDKDLFGTMTICTITMENGWRVAGTSACVSTDNYNKEIGDRIAYDNAFRQLWALEGYLLAEVQYMERELLGNDRED